MDIAAAESVSRRVLTLDPEHAEAKHNLRIVFESVGRGRKMVDFFQKLSQSSKIFRCPPAKRTWRTSAE
jgi:hypothetical protein